MAALQLSSSCGPEAFAGVLEAPEIEVADLRSFGCRETEDVPGGDAPSVTGARWDSVAQCGFAAGGVCDAGIEFLVLWWCGVGWTRWPKPGFRHHPEDHDECAFVSNLALISVQVSAACEFQWRDGIW